jgi:hypothetical protein
MIERNFSAFSTGMFRDKQPDDELDQWFLGEDCARWLHPKLIAVEGIEPGAAPLEGDWGGWTFAIRVHHIWFWIKIWCSFDERGTWIVGIEPRSDPFGAFRKQRTKLAKAELCSAIDSVFASAPEVTDWQCLEKHPAG